MPQRELNKEMHIYHEYLAKQKKEEEDREKELDSLIQAEVEKQWARRLEQWKQEKVARRKLMQDVLNTRKKQIEEKRMYANILISLPSYCFTFPFSVKNV